jgi:hypothetical protein
MDPSTAAAWRDLYIGTVGAGASLTGLTFVAIALDPHQSSAHRCSVCGLPMRCGAS